MDSGYVVSLLWFHCLSWKGISWVLFLEKLAEDAYILLKIILIPTSHTDVISISQSQQHLYIGFWKRSRIIWDVVGPSLLLYMDADIRTIMHVSAHGKSVSEWRSDVIFTVSPWKESLITFEWSRWWQGGEKQQENTREEWQRQESWQRADEKEQILFVSFDWFDEARHDNWIEDAVWMRQSRNGIKHGKTDMIDTNSF